MPIFPSARSSTPSTVWLARGRHLESAAEAVLRRHLRLLKADGAVQDFGELPESESPQGRRVFEARWQVPRDVTVRARLTVTGSSGLTAEATSSAHPKITRVTVKTQPTGIAVANGLESGLSPVNNFYTWGGVAQLLVPETTVLNGKTYRFTGWSDGVTTPQRTITVPASAITRSGALDRLLVAEGDRVRLRMVTLGETQGDWTEVLSGLAVGERVVASPSPVIAARPSSSL